MSHKENWKNYLVFAKESRGNHVSDAILAADRVVRAAVALSHKAFLYANATLPDGETLVDLDRLHRAVENFEREAK